MTNTLRKAVLNNDAPHSAVSDKYKFIPTMEYLTPFLNNGWEIVGQKGGTTPFAAHTITLEHPDFTGLVDGDKMRIMVVNSHDRSCKFTVAGGYFRMVCSNGLMIGEDFEAFSFKHIGQGIEEKLENSYEKIVAKLSELKEKFITLSQLEVSDDDAKQAVVNIASRMLNTSSKKRDVKVVDVLSKEFLSQSVRRKEDRGNGAFEVMNRIQENMSRRNGFAVITETHNKDEEGNVISIDRDRKYTSPTSKGTNVLRDFKLQSIITSEFLKLVA